MNTQPFATATDDGILLLVNTRDLAEAKAAFSEYLVHVGIAADDGWVKAVRPTAGRLARAERYYLDAKVVDKEVWPQWAMSDGPRPGYLQVLVVEGET